MQKIKYEFADGTTSEIEAAENGVIKAELDETGENKTEYEYIDGTATVKEKKLPNGSKFAYGCDGDGNVTSITQSTADGESNSTEIKYTLGSPTKLTSGNNTVFYEYDKKRRKTKVTVNGRETNYEYAENTKSETVISGSHILVTKDADMTAVSFEGNRSEIYTDKDGNVPVSKINEKVFYGKEYFSDGRPFRSCDTLTNSVTCYGYKNDGTDALNKVFVYAGENVESLTESYFYNDCGQISGRAISGAADQSYAYFYKDNAERELEHISLPGKT